MQHITMREALRQALDEELTRDERVFLLGEDIADPMGGSYKITLGLSTKHGTERVRNTPISEQAIVGAGVGAVRSLVSDPFSEAWARRAEGAPSEAVGSSVRSASGSPSGSAEAGTSSEWVGEPSRGV